MSEWPVLRTDRLLLRGWREEDRAPMAGINGDPRVMEFIGEPMTRERSDEFVDRIVARFESEGCGLWAVEVPGVSPLVGFVGLNRPTFEAPFLPATEIGWRLGTAYWGRGYASEAARAALAFAFGELALSEVVSFTTAGNARSRRVMERLGMSRDLAGDFDHPMLPTNHPLRAHVLYRIGAGSTAGGPGRRSHRFEGHGPRPGWTNTRRAD